jgi:malate dehydrogenase
MLENKKLPTPVVPHSPSKLTVIGAAGGIGSSTAFHVGLSGLYDEIVLIDTNENVLATHEIDLRECFVGETRTRVKEGDWEDVAGSEVVVMCAARSGAQVESRNEYLLANLELIRQTANKLNEHAPDCFLIVATAPLDVYVMIYAEELGRPRHKVMGYCRNDTHRFRWFLGQAIGVDPNRAMGFVIGEHGEDQVPVWSAVTVDGAPYVLKESEREEADRLVRDWYTNWQELNAKRTTTWSSAVGMYRTLQALQGDPRGGPLMGSVVLEGEYGLSGVAVGVPLRPGPDGCSWERVVELPLKEGERAALAKAADKIKGLYREARDAK